MAANGDPRSRRMAANGDPRSRRMRPTATLDAGGCGQRRPSYVGVPGARPPGRHRGPRRVRRRQTSMVERHGNIRAQGALVLVPALHSTSRFRRCRLRDGGTGHGGRQAMRRQARARGRRCLMPRTVSTAQARKAAERTAASKTAKAVGKRAAGAAAPKTPAQTGTGTSKDVMQTAAQTEPAAEEIADIVGMDGLDAEAEAAALMEAEALAEAAVPVAEVDLDDQTSTMGDSVHTYLKSIGRTSLLTAEQEVNLAKRIEAGLYAEHKLETEPDLDEDYRRDLELVAEDGRRAKAHMLEANLRLVVSVGKKYSDQGLSLRAVEKFDYTKGYKFSTYAMWWIRQAIQRGFADAARTIRLPVHVLEMLSKLSRVERDMHQRLGREPTPEELAVELDRTPDQIEELLRTSRQPISLDSTIGEDGETSIGDLIEDTDSPEASELVDRQLMADQLRRALGVLSAREEKIMAMRFGLYDGTPRTLDEIGKHLGLTRERIRQLEKESLSKLRHPSNAQPLLDFAS